MKDILIEALNDYIRWFEDDKEKQNEINKAIKFVEGLP